MMFFYLAQVVGLQFLIDQNRDQTTDFWGAKHIPAMNDLFVIVKVGKLSWKGNRKNVKSGLS